MIRWWGPLHEDDSPLARLVGELSRLPGIGPKTATRLAHHLLRVPRAEAAELTQAILDAGYHSITHNFAAAGSPTAAPGCGAGRGPPLRAAATWLMASTMER